MGVAHSQQNNNMESDSPREGFEEVEEEHLPSKDKEKPREDDLFFKIPEAKPLLSKIAVDPKKPKILIRNIKFDLQYPQLFNAQLAPFVVNYQRLPKRQNLNRQSTLWQRYVSSSQYKCLYMKYYSTKSDQSQIKGKKLKLQLQRNTLGNQWLLATYVVDMAFLNQTTSLMTRNLASSSLLAEQQKLDKNQEEIVFSSTFQSGNLMYVFAKIDLQQPREFHLILQNDINTKGFANWFFFKLFSPKPGPLRFHLANLQKIFSFFGYGMKPTVFSLRQGRHWMMEGSNISYSKNDLFKSELENQKYNILSFTIDQKEPNDTLVISAGVPYTYSRLLLFLQNIEKTARSKNNLYFKKQFLTKTISGNLCPMVTLTLKRERKDDKGRKKIIVIIARQHPNEIVSSWVCEGVIEGLLKNTEESEQLLKKYIFKIVPMVNIDGVIYGNSRCDISGSDCNRKWTRTSNQTLFPVVTAIRKLVTSLLLQGHQIEYFLDLHGHSKKLGSFMYCCKANDEVQSRIFAWLMSKITQRFVFDECRFGVSAFRRETARGFFGTMLPNRKAITLQTSFFGYKSGGTLKPFIPAELKELGQNLLTTIHADTFRVNGIVDWATVRNQIRQEMNKSRRHQEEESSGSDSDPEGEELTPQEKAITFLSPAVASKIGLMDIKVVQKPRRHGDSHSPEFKKSQLSQQAKLNLANSNLMMSQTLHPKDISGNNGNPLSLRETKSVTKIEPFRFKSVQKKASSKSKRIRIAIDVQRMEVKQPRKSAPVLPEVHPPSRHEFWRHLQHQFESLINQKKNILMEVNTRPQRKIKQ